jgi:SAM-dependent methyltransferase
MFASLIFGKNTNQTLLRISCLLGAAIVLLWLYRGAATPRKEGFSQQDRFVSKYGADIYDDFYSKIYDNIHSPQNQYETIYDIIKMTEPDKDSQFIDIGSGTGSLVKYLQDRGCNIYGVEKSREMQKYSAEKYPSIRVTRGDVSVPMTFDRNAFSHVIVSNFSIYQFKDKRALFRNLYYWLRPNGFIILHLADRNKFDTILPCGIPKLLPSPQKYTKERITDTEIDFIDFTYKGKYEFSDKDDVVFTETFVDSATNNIRKNEQVMYMECIPAILRDVQACGFSVKGQMVLPFDENQYVILLERIM